MDKYPHCISCHGVLLKSRSSNKLDAGVELYECVECVRKVKVCLLCVSTNKPSITSHINNSNYHSDSKLIVFIDHFMYEHIFPAIKYNAGSTSSCMILHDVNSEDLGMQTYCHHFLSVMMSLPQLCYLIPQTPYRLVLSGIHGLTVRGGIINFGDFIHSKNDNMMNVTRYLQSQSYACLYCGRIYDSLPSIDIVENHVKQCIDCQRQFISGKIESPTSIN